MNYNRKRMIVRFGLGLFLSNPTLCWMAETITNAYGFNSNENINRIHTLLPVFDTWSQFLERNREKEKETETGDVGGIES